MAAPVTPGLPAPITTVDPTRGRVFARNRQTGAVVSLTPEDYASHSDFYDPIERQEVKQKVELPMARQFLREEITPVDAVAKGLERAATLGLSDLPQFHAADYGEYLKALEEEYPITTAGAELAGIVGQAALGVGPAALAMKLGKATTGAIAGESIAARLLGGAAGSAAEAAFYGPGLAARDAAINNKPYNMDLVWAHTSGMMGVAGVLGGPLGLLGRRAAKPLAEAEAALKPGAEMTGEEQAARTVASWKDDLHPTIADEMATTSGGTPEVWAALRTKPEYRQFLREGAKDEWLDATSREMADKLTATAQAAESAQVAAGTLKFENAAPHLDPIIAGRALNANEAELAKMQSLLAGTLENPAYRKEIAVAAAEIGEHGPEVIRLRTQMDDAVDRLRKLDLDEEVGTAQLGKMDADMAMLKKQAGGKASPEKIAQWEAAHEVLSARSARLTDELAQVPKIRAGYEQGVEGLRAQLEALKGQGVNIRPAALEGATEIRRMLGHIESSKARIAAEGDDVVRRAARAFSETDALKRVSSDSAKPGMTLGPMDKTGFAFRQVNDSLLKHLEDPDVWGRRLTDMQTKVNAPFHRQLNVWRDVMDRFFVDSGADSAYSTWKQGRMADPGKVRAFLDNLTTPRGDVGLMKLRQFLDAGVEYGEAFRTHYPNMGPLETARFGAASKATNEFNTLLHSATDKASFLNQMGTIARAHGEATREFRIGGAVLGGMFGGPAGAAVGMFIGQRLMNVLNPAPRLTMLARLERTALAHETWQGGIIRRLLGGRGKGPGRPPAPGTAAKPSKRLYVTMSKPLAPALLYDWAKEPEDKKDKQKTAERVVVAMKHAASPAGAEMVKRNMGDMLGTFGEEHPDAAEYMAKKAQAAAAAVAKAAPPNTTPSSALFPQLYRSPWSRRDFQTLEQAVEAAYDPYSTVEKLSTGMVTPEQMDILTEVHPELLAKLRTDLIREAQGMDPPPRAIRQQLSLVLGIATDPATDPEYIAMMQTMHEEREQRYQEATKENKRRTYKPTGVNTSTGGAHETQLTKIEKGEHPR